MPVTNKKLSEILTAERYLPHYNLRTTSNYRIDYEWVKSRDENYFPDVLARDLLTNEEINIEVTKASNLQKIEERDGLQSKFMSGISKIVREATFEGKKISAYVSLNINRLALSKKNIIGELNLFEKSYPTIYLNSYIAEHKNDVALSGDGFKIIQEITIKDDIFPSIGFGWGEAANLDPFQRVMNAYKNKESKIANPQNTILIITIDSDISQYYLDEIFSYFKPLEIPFKEIVISESHKYGRLFFIFNETK